MTRRRAFDFNAIPTLARLDASARQRVRLARRLWAGAARAVVETHLVGLHMARDAQGGVPYFGLAPHLPVDTELVFTTARHLGVQYPRLMPLTIRCAPQKCHPPIGVSDCSGVQNAFFG